MRQSRPTSTLLGEERAPVLCFPLDVWQRLRLFILRCPTEISGFGLVRQSADDPMLFTVEDVLILDQKADGHSTTPDPRAIDQLLYELTLENKASALRLLWHSHVNMEAYFSATDQNAIAHYSGDWMISLVSNYRTDVEARLDIRRPFQVGVPMRVKVLMPLDQQMTDEVDAQIRRHVRRPGLPFLGVRPRDVVGPMVDANEVETEE
jgi:hypothetical protein